MIITAYPRRLRASVLRDLTRSRGFLYCTFTFHPKTGVVTNGKVTGGTGAFAKATGTIEVKTISRTRHAITITYSG